MATPEWARFREKMRRAFPSYFDEAGEDPFAQLIARAIVALNDLRGAPDGPAFLGDDPSGPHYDEVTEARLAPKMADIETVLSDLVGLFQGMPHWNHPLTMVNVVPPANIAAAVASMMSQVFSPNIIEGDYSWNVEVSELESAAIVADMVGWDTSVAGGLYTYGGSGCYLYGIKYALTHVLGEASRREGIRRDVKLLVSRQGHYCKQNATDWLGIGTDNVIEIDTDPESNAMDMAHLEEVLASLHREGTPVAAVVCTMGTTDTFAMDPVRDVRALLERYPNPEGLGRALIYCDAVIGWSWLAFKAYDDEANPLDLSPEVLQLARRNCDAMAQALEADAIGCDFHKSGFTPYNCSLFVVRDLGAFKKLLIRPGSEYLHAHTWYNPGLYTLEVSRSGGYSLAGWATLKFFGQEGFQAILGGILETTRKLRAIVAERGDDIVCCNEATHGFVTLFRVYPEGTDGDAQYARELGDANHRDELALHNRLQERIAEKMWSWFRDGKKHAGNYAPHINYTSGFRSASYDDTPVYALKSYPMNVNVTEEHMRTMVAMVRAARDEVLGEPDEPSPYQHIAANAPPPYREDHAAPSAARPSRIDDLLGGIDVVSRRKP